ncbi:MAG: hypothetical protein H6Q39_1315, partial [Chloroflexi bacterium]|nr:hypothetical protein [Chloroflexota bacterium]
MIIPGKVPLDLGLERYALILNPSLVKLTSEPSTAPGVT